MQPFSHMALFIILGDVTRRFPIVIAAIGCLVLPSDDFAQSLPSQPLPSQTLSSKTIPSWPLDPLMTAEDESRVFRLLGQTIAPPANGTPLRSMVQTLPAELTIAIDDLALDEIGLSAQDPIQVSLPSPAPLIVHLLAILQRLDSTIQLRHNVLTITTHERNEADYPVRVYDVSELTNQSRRYSIDELEQVIQVSIAPDSWEALGGPGVFSTQIAFNKTHLVIANSTVTHLRIDTFLNRIAGDRDYQPIPVVDWQSKSNHERDSLEDSITSIRPAESNLVNFANPDAVGN